MREAIRPHSEAIRAFILKHVRNEGLAGMVAEKFGITRQAANQHLRKLVSEGAIYAEGRTRNRIYKLAATNSSRFKYPIVPGLAEDEVWRADIFPLLSSLPSNVITLWQWAFTEMFNNAIDHSAGTRIMVSVKKTALYTEISVEDDGVGIFKKIQKELGLADERQAIFELSKGKLTTDARNHSGQGIFFTSRMVNAFNILSGGVYFSHEIASEEDWMLERSGTS